MKLTDTHTSPGVNLRHLLLGFFPLLFLSSIATAQQPDTYCGTVQEESSLQWLRQWQSRNHDGALTHVHHRAAEDIMVPVKIHLVGTDEGTGYYGLADLMEALCDLNVQFDSVGFHFYMQTNVNYINNDDFYTHDFSDGYRMMLENNIQQKVNIYFVNDPAGNCGYFSPGVDGIAIRKTCAANGNSTIAHEVGHYFSLPHTFRGWEGGTPTEWDREKVDGSNCLTAGDGFCDTGPDYAPYRWNCPVTGPFTDPDGVVFVPDGTYFMSYSNDACQTRFSPLQRLAMQDNLDEEREELLFRDPPVLKEHGPVTLSEPANGAVNTAFNYTVLKWEKEANATMYVVSIGLNASMSAIAAEAIVEDTFYIAPELSMDRKYYWRVKPISPGNTCSPFTATREFTTGDVASGILNVSPEADLLSLAPNPAFPGQSVYLSFSGSKGVESTIQLIGLDGRVYNRESRRVMPGENRVEWTVPATVPEGMYLIEIQSGNAGVLSDRRVVCLAVQNGSGGF